MTKLPITRANLAGKRRWAIYSDRLADYSGLPLSLLINALRESELREHIDWVYHPNKESYALSLASAQAVVLMAIIWTENPSAWQTWHAITDYIQGQSYANTESTPPTAPQR